MRRKAVSAGVIMLVSPWVARASTQILVPAYFDPSSGMGWSTLNASVSAQVPITAIMNPDSGPAGSVDSSYTAAITGFEAAGGKVVAYVHTTDGSRSLSKVEKDVATYKSEYPNIDGIFVDEMANTASKESYYESLYSYIKSENASWQVIGNPGTNTLSAYLTPTPAADMLVTFENDTGYSTYTPSAWEYNNSAGSFANIVYAVPDAGTMQSDLSLSATDHAGNVYFTDASVTNPYNVLPTYWSQEVAAVKAVNTAVLQGTYQLTGSGDFNSTASWAGAIPNGIGAEADCLSSMTAAHTVYSDISITVGKIVFNNANTYVLAGAGSLTLQTLTGTALVDAQAGTQKITLPTTIASSTVLNADSGATLIIDAPVVINSGETLSETGAGAIKFQSTVTVQAGGTFTISASSSVQSLSLEQAANASVIAQTSTDKSVLQVDSLSMSTGSSLDLKNGDLIVHNGNLSAITSEIQSGLAIGKGIISSTAASDPNHLESLGVILNNDQGTPIISGFDGIAASTTDILVKYTYAGDANLDGRVDGSDFTLIDNGFTGHLTGWYNGDFNYDGVVDGSDYSLIDNAFDATNISAQSTAELAGVGSTNVPEPAVIAATMVGMLGIGRRRRINL